MLFRSILCYLKTQLNKSYCIWIFFRNYSSFTEKHYIYLPFIQNVSLILLFKKLPFRCTVKIRESIFSICLSWICLCLQTWFHSPIGFSSSTKHWILWLELLLIYLIYFFFFHLLHSVWRPGTVGKRNHELRSVWVQHTVFYI